MKKMVISWTVVMLLSMGAVQNTFAHMEDEGINQVELTEEQKQEISELVNDIMEKKKELINKYVEFGVISEEKGERIISKFDQHYNKLEENGFVPNWDKHKEKYKHKKCEKQNN